MENNYKAYIYAGLIAKHLKGELSVADEIRLNNWLKESPENALLLKKLQDEGTVRSELDLFDSIDDQKAWQNILSRTQQPSLTHHIYHLILKWKYAAIILVTFSLGLILYKTYQPVKPVQQVAGIKTSKYKNDVPPGTDKAQLTLADGSVIMMNEGLSGNVKNNDGLNISVKHGLVTYTGANNTNRASKGLYNMITTPLGSKYKVTLPDGSLVWLNSGSSIKFPVVFSKSERKIYLTGEGYFEVAKNKHKPFKVVANNTVIQVLGTHFNVAAYKNEAAVKTTLLEGSVKITSNRQSKMIVPGQQACINKDSPKINIKTIDVNGSIAWKNNLFLFDNTDIESVMRDVARWYNVEIIYQDAVPQVHFSGSIPRDNNISQILNMLELTGGVHFAIDGRKVTVTK